MSTISASTTSTTAYKVTADTTGTLVLQTGSSPTTAATFDASQNMGLGVTPSAWSGFTALQVSNAMSLWSSSGGNAYLNNNTYYDGTARKYVFTGAASEYVQSGGSHAWKTAASGSAGTNITFTQAMTLDASGNLGVGSTSPNLGGLTRALTLNTPAAGNYSGVELAGAGTLSARFITNNAGTYIGSQLSMPLVFETNATERARIDSSGNLLVGQTTASQSSLGFFAKQTGEVSGCMAASTNGGATQWNTYSTGASAFRFYVGMGGTVYATSTTITGISDQRLKENIRDLDEGLDTVMALRPRKFDWKEGKGADIKNARGFIAQEFEEVLPDMIEEWKDPAPEGEEPYKAVNANLIPTLVKAIQEQQAIIETLTNRITALEAK